MKSLDFRLRGHDGTEAAPVKPTQKLLSNDSARQGLESRHKAPHPGPLPALRGEGGTRAARRGRVRGKPLNMAEACESRRGNLRADRRRVSRSFRAMRSGSVAAPLQPEREQEEAESAAQQSEAGGFGNGRNDDARDVKTIECLAMQAATEALEPEKAKTVR